MDDIPENEAAVTTPDNDVQQPELTELEIAEKRRRDTQSAYTKERQKVVALEAEIAELKKMASQSNLNLTPDQKQELEDLKYSDPDTWRAKADSYEQEHRKSLDEKLTQARYNAEVQRRAKVLEDYNNSNPDHQLTNDVIKFDIPPRITEKLEKGEISFESFLEEANAYLKKGKVIADTETSALASQPDLSKVGGGSIPSKEGVVEDNYATEIY